MTVPEDVREALVEAAGEATGGNYEVVVTVAIDTVLAHLEQVGWYWSYREQGVLDMFADQLPEDPDELPLYRIRKDVP